jgi:protein-S-isoprenylcysteine O-methyltransferase Ste14
MVAPPPLLFVAAFLTGFALDHLVPLPRPGADVAETLRVGGWIVFALGHMVMFAGIGRFARARTTILPHGHASALVTSGVYGFTRNPMYVGLTIAYLGLTAQQRLLWALPFLPLPLIALARVIVPFEEARLRRLFGDAYTAYCGRVRRWI